MSTSKDDILDGLENDVLLDIEKGVLTDVEEEIQALGSGEWKPYSGPRGGEGWQNVNDPEDIRYGLENPPGEVAEGYEEQAEQWGSRNWIGDDPWGGDSEWSEQIPEYNAFASDPEETVWACDKVIYEDVNGKQTGQIKQVEGEDEYGQLYTLMDGSEIYHHEIEAFSRAPESKVARTSAGRVRVGDFVIFENQRIDDIGSGKVIDVWQDGHGASKMEIVNVEEGTATVTSVPGEWGGREEWGSKDIDMIERECPEEYKGVWGMQSVYDFPSNASTPPDLDPRNSDDIRTLSGGGISADSMAKAHDVNDTGRSVFVTNLSLDQPLNAEGRTDAQRVITGARTMKLFGFDPPAHHWEKGEYWVTEEAPGVEASNWAGDPEDIDRQQFIDLQAAAYITGNWDLHGNNVFVDSENNLVPVDLDLAGHSIDTGFHSTIEGRMKSLHRALGFEEDIEKMAEDVTERMEEMAHNEELMEQVKGAAEADWIRSNIQSNIENAKYDFAFGPFQS